MTTPDHMARALAQVDHPDTPWEGLDRHDRALARIRAAQVLDILAAGSPRVAADCKVADSAKDLITRHGAHCSQTVRDALENLWEVADEVRRH